MTAPDSPVWKNGLIVPWEEATVHIFSHGFSRGSAVFEVLSCEKTDSGRALFRPVEHLRRMTASAKQIGMKIPYRQGELIDAMKRVVLETGFETAMVKIFAIWAGFEFEVLPRNKDVTVMATCLPFPKPDAGKAKGARGRWKGFKAIIADVRKLDPATVPVTAKITGNYVNPLMARLEAVKRRVDIPIMLDAGGYVAEGPTESVFAVKKGKLFTPPEGNILPGITRMSVIQLARDMGIDVEEKNIGPSFLKNADELFFTYTTDWIVHARSLDGKRIGDGSMGPVTRKLLDRFEEAAAGRVERYRKWLVPVEA